MVNKQEKKFFFNRNYETDYTCVQISFMLRLVKNIRKKTMILRSLKSKRGISSTVYFQRPNILKKSKVDSDHEYRI